MELRSRRSCAANYNGPRAETPSIGSQATNHRQLQRPAEELLAPNSTVGSCRVAAGGAVRTLT